MGRGKRRNDIIHGVVKGDRSTAHTGQEMREYSDM